MPSIIAVYLCFKAFSAGANIPTLKGYDRGYGSFIAHLEALENGLLLRRRTLYPAVFADTTTIYHMNNADVPPKEPPNSIENKKKPLG